MSETMPGHDPRGRAGRWFLGLLGTPVLGLILSGLLGILAAAVVGVVAEAHKEGTAYVVVLAVASGLVVFLVLTLIYLVKVAPWLAKFRPVPEAEPSLRRLREEADRYCSGILRFERRAPDGTPLSADQIPLLERLDSSDPNRIGDDYTRFDSMFGHNLRNMFFDLKAASHVDDDDMLLFYSPRTPQDRIDLARLLRQVAIAALDHG